MADLEKMAAARLDEPAETLIAWNKANKEIAEKLDESSEALAAHNWANLKMMSVIRFYESEEAMQWMVQGVIEFQW